MKTNILLVTREQAKEGLLPVMHLSYSSIREYMTSANLFYKKYVRYEFDNVMRPAMAVGSAVHKGLELYYGKLIGAFEIKEDDAPESEDKTVAYAIGHFREELENARQKAIAQLGFEISDVETEEGETRRFWLNKAGEYINLVDGNAQIEKLAIEWGKTGSQAKCEAEIEQAVRNYFQAAEKPFIVEGVEVTETAEFYDLNGQLMPLPLKAKIDRTEETEDFLKGITDYKVVAKFSNDEDDSAGYEVQATVAYFVYYAMHGRAPDYFRFTEILKSEPGVLYPKDPTRKLLQADLKQLADENGLQYAKFVKNEELKAMLLEANVLEYEKPCRDVYFVFDAENTKFSKAKVIDFAVFFELYYRIINALAISSIYDLPPTMLPNPFDQMSGKDAWAEFKSEIQLFEKPQPRRREELPNIDDLEI